MMADKKMVLKSVSMHAVYPNDGVYCGECHSEVNEAWRVTYDQPRSRKHDVEVTVCASCLRSMERGNNSEGEV